jgi:hypothetical protein
MFGLRKSLDFKIVQVPYCQFPIFCCFCVSEKLHRKYSRNWTKQKPNLLFLPKLREDRRWDGGGPGARLTTGPGARHPMVRPGGPPPDDALSYIKSPRREKPKGRISFPWNILQAAAVTVARSGGSRSSFRHPARERNPCRRPSTPPWLPPEWCVSSLPWTTGPYQ